MKNQLYNPHLIVDIFSSWSQKIVNKKFPLFICFTMCLISGISNSQTSADKLPNRIVVRLNPNLLDWSVIDDDKITRTNLKKIVNSDGREQIEIQSNKLGVNFGDLEVTKMFPHLHTKDSLSITRLGKVVYMPPFWATFFVTVAPDEDYWRLRKSIIESFPLALYADLPLVMEQDYLPNDSLFDYQLSLFDSIVPNQTISLKEAWGIETGKSFIKVGIHDTGVDKNHEDLTPITGFRYGLPHIDSLGVPIYDFGYDFIGHGTCVGGIIGAKRNNGVGIAGIAGGDILDDTAGVSLIDFSYDWTEGDHVAMGVIDGARSVGSYYSWVSTPTVNIAPNEAYYFNQAVGYGINIGNHSYGLRVLASPVGSGRDLPNSDTITWENDRIVPPCNLCREAFLFSLQNGVSNIVSRGNNKDFTEPTSPLNRYPQRFDDDWIVTVGASGTDGERLVGGLNTGSGEVWFSPIGQNIDIIAPGSKASIVSTRSTNLPNGAIFGKYRNFNGTSASAPHVSGVAALLMSHYNKPCYSNVNLDPADIEYILSKSATQVNENVPIGAYDDSTGWGRLNAFNALNMINFPEFQIVHPIDSYVNRTELSRDTISLFIEDPINYLYGGPLSSTFQAIQINRFYRAERVKYSLEYNFSNYRLPSNELLDIWVRASETNSLGFVADTFTYFTGNPAIGAIIASDTMSISPKATIESYTDSSVIFSGYYYHLINKFDDLSEPIGSTSPMDYWYPINPAIDTTRIAFSIYLRDSLASIYWDFPCTAENNLLDSFLVIKENHIDDFELYPNPSTGELKVRLNSTGNYRELTIVNISGQLMKRIKIHEDQGIVEMELGDLGNGIYFVNLLSDNGLSTKKWIKL